MITLPLNDISNLLDSIEDLFPYASTYSVLGRPTSLCISNPSITYALVAYSLHNEILYYVLLIDIFSIQVLDYIFVSSFHTYVRWVSNNVIYLNRNSVCIHLNQGKYSLDIIY